MAGKQNSHVCPSCCAVLTLAAQQAQGHLRNKLVVRPARLDHRFHNRVKAAVGDKQVKAAKVRTREDFDNPEQEKAIQEKAIEERIKAECALDASLLSAPPTLTSYAPCLCRKTYARKQQQVHSSFSVRPAQRLRHDFNAEMLEEEDEEQYDEADLRYDSSGRGRGALSRRGGLDEDDEVRRWGSCWLLLEHRNSLRCEGALMSWLLAVLQGTGAGAPCITLQCWWDCGVHNAVVDPRCSTGLQAGGSCCCFMRWGWASGVLHVLHLHWWNWAISYFRQCTLCKSLLTQLASMLAILHPLLEHWRLDTFCMCRVQREAAQRLQSAKRQPAPRPVGKKRSRGNISSEEEAEEEDGEYDEPSAEDDSGEEGQDAVKAAAKAVVHKPKVKRGVVISSDEED